jgi:HD-GYP domain-containing protein (c-di-GMP phosphodiesterase class II)
VIDEQGRVLITAGTVLKPEMTHLLRRHEVAAVWIEDISRENHEINDLPSLISTQTREQMVVGLQKAFANPAGAASQLPALRSYVEQVVAQLSQRQDVLLYLSDAKVKSDYLFIHCVNVGLFAIALGLALNMSKEDICLLGMGGLLHDFGKTRISTAILNKQGPLTLAEFKRVKEHAAIGYNILKMEGQVDSRILLMALQHHERCDGRGYPWGITKSEIHPLARIVAIADVYDALTTNRAYRRRLPTWEAFRIISEGRDVQFDAEVVRAFQKIAVSYTIGCRIKLNNGMNGAVTRLNSADLSRPIVMTEQGLINLLYEPEIDIVTAL